MKNEIKKLHSSPWSLNTLVALVLLLLAGALPVAGQSVSDRLSRQLFYDEHIVQVGPRVSSEQEAQLLLETLEAWRASRYQNGVEQLEEFLNTLTNSPWAPSLDAVLGRYYYDVGRYTLALEHYELAWAATKHDASRNGKRVADLAFANWTRLLASLGRYETLAALYQETRGRVLDRGPLSQKWARTREALAEMRQKPGISYKCGTFALNNAARALHLNYDVAALMDVPSPATGFSMQALSDLSTKLRLGLVPVHREAGQEIPVPSVVHWRQNHYAAIVSVQGGFYKVVDPTFENTRYMSAETINAEASGYFFVPQSQIPANFRMISAGEGGAIYGRGNPNFYRDKDDQGCPTSSGGNSGNPAPPMGSKYWGDDGNEAGGGCSSCGGMPVWRVSEPYINLWLHDEPLGYQPAYGPRVSFHLSYKQRNESTGIHHDVGGNWGSMWLSYFDAQGYAPYGVVPEGYLHLPGGGVSTFYNTETTATNYYNNLRLTSFTNGIGYITSFDLDFPDGAKYVYDYHPSTSEKFYLTKIKDPQGNTVTLEYETYDPIDPHIDLKYIIDATGLTNTITYDTSLTTHVITNVVGPS